MNIRTMDIREFLDLLTSEFEDSAEPTPQTLSLSSAISAIYHKAYRANDLSIALSCCALAAANNIDLEPTHAS